jgi:hypothetical protein
LIVNFQTYYPSIFRQRVRNMKPLNSDKTFDVILLFFIKQFG